VNLDYAEALRWYTRGADAGHALSMAAISRMYELGQGVSRNMAEAERWRRAAEQNGLRRRAAGAQPAIEADEAFEDDQS
jgi:TPR repeat protein